MNPFLPPLLVVFFGIFHIVGGAAVGRGMREAMRGSDQAVSQILWGGVMGGLPLIFDWLFLVDEGQLILGLVGPVLFVGTALAGAFLRTKIDGAAAMAAAIGSATFLIGVLVIPIMLDRIRESNPGIEDYAFASCFVLLFVVIGGSFAWAGISALVRGIPLDQEYAKREHKLQRPRKREVDGDRG